VFFEVAMRTLVSLSTLFTVFVLRRLWLVQQPFSSGNWFSAAVLQIGTALADGATLNMAAKYIHPSQSQGH
jgi:hypothetical protein